LFFPGRNFLPDALGLGLHMFLSLKARILSVLLNQDCLMNKGGFFGSSCPPPCVSELDFPLRKPHGVSAPE